MNSNQLLLAAINSLLIISLIITGCSSSSVIRSGSSQNISQGTGSLFKQSNTGTMYTSTDTTEHKSIIRAGDQLQIMVWGYPEFNTTSTVKDNGTVTLPLIGDVIAAGLSTDRFTVQVSERLTEYIKGEPKVTVSHIEMNKRISVMGAVNKQDNYPTISDVSLVEIIAAAGGPAPDADLSHVKIFRNGNKPGTFPEIAEVDLTEHLEKGDMDKIPKVRSGDTVFIPKEENVIRDLSDFFRDILLLFGFFFIL
jgi:polysaccharide export outer membrane protein